MEVALGYVPALYQLVDLKLLQGRCDEHFLQSKLTTREAAIYRQVTRFSVSVSAKNPLSGHAIDCLCAGAG